jgi:hypothetical protein
VGENTIDQILSKMAIFPVHVVKVLISVSCFGPKFDSEILQSVACKLFTPNDPNFISKLF